MASLVFLAGPIAGRRFKLADGAYVIGRRSDCQIFVPDMRVSRQHARLSREGDGWVLEDLGSNNGTFLNGQKVQYATTLRHEDEILIANNRIRVEGRDATADPYPDGGPVTIVDAGAADAIIRAREDRIATDHAAPADPREVRLLERKLEALTQVLRVTASSDTAEALLANLADALLDVFAHATDVGVLVEDERTRELVVQVQKHRAERGGALRVPGAILEHVAAERRGVLLGDTRTTAADGGGIGTRMGAALVYHGARYGVVYVEGADAGFRQEDVDLLQAIAIQAGLAIHATRAAAQLATRDRLERDLRVARQIQRSLLPASVPRIAGLDFAVHYEPAYQIGGDFYDFIWHDPAHLGLAIGDVSGKAISAALYMARVTSELRSRAPIAHTPARLLRRVNAEIASLGDDGMFATLVYCIYDLETRSLVFTNAGHCVPLVRRGARVFPLQAERAHTPPLGVAPDLDAGEARVQLQGGDLLMLISDGILEARDPAGHEYGLDRLARCLRATHGPAEDVIKAVLADLDAHTGPQGPGDDVTIVAMAIDERRARRRSSTPGGVALVEERGGRVRVRAQGTAAPPTGPGGPGGPGDPGDPDGSGD